MRLSGKREVGQMTPFDLTLLLLISNSVQNAMTGPDTSLLGGIVAAATLLVVNYLVAEVSGLNRRFRRVVEGSPTLLVHNGQALESHMAREHVSHDELTRALREHGIANLTDVALAVLEVDLVRPPFLAAHRVEGAVVEDVAVLVDLDEGDALGDGVVQVEAEDDLPRVAEQLPARRVDHDRDGDRSRRIQWEARQVVGEERRRASEGLDFGS